MEQLFKQHYNSNMALALYSINNENLLIKMDLDNTFDIQIYRNKSKSNDNIDHFSMESCLFEIEFSFDILSFPAAKKRDKQILNRKMSSLASKSNKIN